MFQMGDRVVVVGPVPNLSVGDEADVLKYEGKNDSPNHYWRLLHYVQGSNPLCHVIAVARETSLKLKCEHKDCVEEKSSWFHGDFGLRMGEQVVSRCVDCGHLSSVSCTIGEVSVCGLSLFRPTPINWLKIEYVTDLCLKDHAKGASLLKKMTAKDAAWVCWLYAGTTNRRFPRELAAAMLGEEDDERRTGKDPFVPLQ